MLPSLRHADRDNTRTVGHAWRQRRSSISHVRHAPCSRIWGRRINLGISSRSMIYGRSARAVLRCLAPAERSKKGEERVARPTTAVARFTALSGLLSLPTSLSLVCATRVSLLVPLYDLSFSFLSLPLFPPPSFPLRYATTAHATRLTLFRALLICQLFPRTGKEGSDRDVISLCAAGGSARERAFTGTRPMPQMSPPSSLGLCGQGHPAAIATRAPFVLRGARGRAKGKSHTVCARAS